MEGLFLSLTTVLALLFQIVMGWSIHLEIKEASGRIYLELIVTAWIAVFASEAKENTDRARVISCFYKPKLIAGDDSADSSTTSSLAVKHRYRSHTQSSKLKCRKKQSALSQTSKKSNDSIATPSANSIRTPRNVSKSAPPGYQKQTVSSALKSYTMRMEVEEKKSASRLRINLWPGNPKAVAVIDSKLDIPRHQQPTASSLLKLRKTCNQARTNQRAQKLKVSPRAEVIGSVVQRKTQTPCALRYRWHTAASAFKRRPKSPLAQRKKTSLPHCA